MTADWSLADSMAAIAEALHHQTEPEHVIRLIASAALRMVPGAAHVGVSVAHPKDRFETVAATGPAVHHADAAQFSSGEGPCVDAMRGLDVALSRDLADESRWPTYAPQAVGMGLRAQLGIPLTVSDQRPSSLNLYAETAGSFDDDAVRIAVLFSRHAAQALAHARTRQQLTDVLTTRKTVNQAVGIVMERFRLTEQQAFTYLSELSRAGGTRVRVIADRIVAEVDDGAR